MSTGKSTNKKDDLVPLKTKKLFKGINTKLSIVFVGVLIVLTVAITALVFALINRSDDSNDLKSFERLSLQLNQVQGTIQTLQMSVTRLDGEVQALKEGSNSTSQFVTLSALQATLQSYATSTSLNNAVQQIDQNLESNYVDSTRLNTQLEFYASEVSLQGINSTIAEIQKDILDLESGGNTNNFATSQQLQDAVNTIDQNIQDNYVSVSDLDDYDYITGEQLNQTLEEYVNQTNYQSDKLFFRVVITQLNGTILQVRQDLVNLESGNQTGNFVTNTQFNSTLQSYALSSSLQDVNETLQQIASDLGDGDIVTSVELEETLGAYVLQTDLQNINTTVAKLGRDILSLESGNQTGNFVNNQTLSNALQSYVTNLSLENTLSSYATSDQLDSYALYSDLVEVNNTLFQSISEVAAKDTVTSSELDQILVDYATVSALDHVNLTLFQLITEVFNNGGEITQSELDATLANYITNTALTNQLGSYATVASLANYVTSSTLASYATQQYVLDETAQVNDILASAQYTQLNGFDFVDSQPNITDSTVLSFKIFEPSKASENGVPEYTYTQFMGWEQSIVGTCPNGVPMISNPLAPSGFGTYTRFCPCPVSDQAPGQNVLYDFTLSINNLMIQRNHDPDSNLARLNFGFVYDDEQPLYSANSVYGFNFAPAPFPPLPPIATFTWNSGSGYYLGNNQREVTISLSQTTKIELPTQVAGSPACYKFIMNAVDIFDSSNHGAMAYDILNTNQVSASDPLASSAILSIQKSGWVVPTY